MTVYLKKEKKYVSSRWNYLDMITNSLWALEFMKLYNGLFKFHFISHDMADLEKRYETTHWRHRFKKIISTEATRDGGSPHLPSPYQRSWRHRFKKMISTPSSSPPTTSPPVPPPSSSPLATSPPAPPPSSSSTSRARDFVYPSRWMAAPFPVTVDGDSQARNGGC